MRTRFLLCLPLLLASAVLPSAQEGAGDAAKSGWSEASHASLRLIAGATAPSGKQRVGVEIVMKPGYKTYWRSPGEFGAPPNFDWAGSLNVGGLDVRWPVPERFDDAGGTSIGYAGAVVIPISVQPVDPSRPVMVVLKLDYAVCDRICVPQKGEAQLWLEPGVTTVSSPRLDAFQALVPQHAELGVGRDRLAVLAAKPEEAAGAAQLRLELFVPEGGSVEDVFVEGGPGWRFARPVLSREPDGATLARLRLVERPKGASGPAPFIVTLRGGPRATETRLELDIPQVKP